MEFDFLNKIDYYSYSQKNLKKKILVINIHNLKKKIFKKFKLTKIVIK